MNWDKHNEDNDQLLTSCLQLYKMPWLNAFISENGIFCSHHNPFYVFLQVFRASPSAIKTLNNIIKENIGVFPCKNIGVAAFSLQIKI